MQVSNVEVFQTSFEVIKSLLFEALSYYLIVGVSTSSQLDFPPKSFRSASPENTPASALAPAVYIRISEA
jgi:hypothetical protein